MRFDRDTLRSPSKEYSVVYAWLWNTTITREGIDAKLREFKDAGIGGIYIIPLPKDFRPENLRTFMSPEYLSEEFFDLCEYAIRRAAAEGLEVWIYDEGGWPSGGACGQTLRDNPDAVCDVILHRPREIKNEELYTLPDDAVAIFEGKDRLPDSFLARRNIQAEEYYIEHKVFNTCKVDCTSASVIDSFISNTYEKYRERLGDMFGKGISLIFTDEPGVSRNALPKGGFDIFYERFGYDLRDYIYVVDDYGEKAVTDEEIRARIDFGTMNGDLFCKNNFGHLADWCEAAGIAYGGHISGENRIYGGMTSGCFSMLRALSKMHVPGIDVIWEQIRYPYGTRSPLDEESYDMSFFPRIATSAARQTGKNLALTETYSIYGEAITPDEMKYVSNYQAIRGINIFNFLNLSYSTERCAPLMMRPSFIKEKPGFYNLRHINEYYARLSYLLRLGEAEGDTALYMPCRDYWADPKSCDKAIDSFSLLGKELEEKNIPFDIIDDFTVRDAEQTEAGLKIGDALYKNVVIPSAKYIDDDVLAIMKKYEGEGAPTYSFKSSALRVLTRKLDTGRLWFVFNEGEAPVCEAISFEKSPLYSAGDLDNMKIYEIDLSSGEMYAETKSPEMKLLCGDIVCYLVTSEDHETVSKEGDEILKIEALVPFSYDRFNIDYYKISSSYHEGAPIIDESFSGTVHCRAEYSFDRAPKKNERYRIKLIDTAVSAEVKIDGKSVCTLGMSPMQAVVMGSAFKKSGIIEVSISNTASNEVVAKHDVIHSHPKAEVGVYVDRMEIFENRRPELKIGSLVIEKMK